MQPQEVEEGEDFKAIAEAPGFFISNHKRVYNSKTKRILKANPKFGTPQGTFVTNTLVNKYFNQPDELNLIAILKHFGHRFRDYYFDRSDEKFYRYYRGAYHELKPLAEYSEPDLRSYEINANDGGWFDITPSFVKTYLLN